MALVAAGAAIAVMVLPHTGRLVEVVLARIPMPPGMRARLLRLAEQVLLGLKAFHHWGRLTGFVLLTVAIWLADSVVTMLSGHALGVEIPFRVALLLLTGLGLGSALPSTPGYVGIYQFVAVTVLTPFGILKDDALAYILVAQALAYVVLVVLGLPGLYTLRRSRT